VQRKPVQDLGQCKPVLARAADSYLSLTASAHACSTLVNPVACEAARVGEGALAFGGALAGGGALATGGALACGGTPATAKGVVRVIRQWQFLFGWILRDGSRKGRSIEVVPSPFA
jgi:hypothetical protein